MSISFSFSFFFNFSVKFRLVGFGERILEASPSHKMSDKKIIQFAVALLCRH